MGDVKGFLKVKRETVSHRPVAERVKDFREIPIARSEEKSQAQGSRCMDCGTPFCHFGCPIGNYIPEWNDAIFRGQWQKALGLLLATNDFPELTGRLCPAPCEASCVLGINDEPVTIRENEFAIIEHAFKKGYLLPAPPKRRTGKKVAVVGSGPSGLSAATSLNRLGHNVVVFEKDARIGGVLRYGVPDFKLEKWILDRRIRILEKEGIKFRANVFVGVEYKVEKLKEEFDAAILCGGSSVPRDLKIDARDLGGVHFAMDYLIQSNRMLAGEPMPSDKLIGAKGKRVVVIGGGDTGSDCVGVAHRQGAASVVQIELMPRPPECRGEDMPWPKYPMILKTTTSHEEGGARQWSVLTKRFYGKQGVVTGLECVRVEFAQKDERGCPLMKEVPGSNFSIDADLVILALGFLHPRHEGLLDNLGVEYDNRGNVKTDSNYATKVKGIFSAGDMHRGQSLVVWALHEGRQAALAVDAYLGGNWGPRSEKRKAKSVKLKRKA